MAAYCIHPGRLCDGCMSCQSGPNYTRAAELLDMIDALEDELREARAEYESIIDGEQGAAVA